MHIHILILLWPSDVDGVGSSLKFFILSPFFIVSVQVRGHIQKMRSGWWGHVAQVHIWLMFLKKKNVWFVFFCLLFFFPLNYYHKKESGEAGVKGEWRAEGLLHSSCDWFNSTLHHIRLKHLCNWSCSLTACGVFCYLTLWLSCKLVTSYNKQVHWSRECLKTSCCLGIKQHSAIKRCWMFVTFTCQWCNLANLVMVKYYRIDTISEHQKKTNVKN